MFEYYMAPLTRTQRRNLDRLATYLESLPRGYEDFDMTSYIGIEDEGYDGQVRNATPTAAMEHYAQYNGSFKELGCGTVACAVGHGPSAGIFVDDSCLNTPWYTTVRSVSWDDYARKNFTNSRNHQYDYRFEWLFGSDWSYYDNHHWSAAARIRYLLANKGNPPPQFMEDGACAHRKYCRLYKPYKITKRHPLPAGFYTKTMLARFTEGAERAKKLDRLNTVLTR